MSDETATIKIADLEAIYTDRSYHPLNRENLSRLASDVECAAEEEVLRLIADALPAPWPTTPGSTGQCRDGHWFGIDAEGMWRRFMTGAPCPPDFLRQMGFTPRHDAGADQ